MSLLCYVPPGESGGGLHKLLDHSSQEGPCWLEVYEESAEECNDEQSINSSYLMLLHSLCRVMCYGMEVLKLQQGYSNVFLVK